MPIHFDEIHTKSKFSNFISSLYRWFRFISHVSLAKHAGIWGGEMPCLPSFVHSWNFDFLVSGFY